VNVNPKRSGAIIVPVHTVKTQRRLLEQTRKKSIRAGIDSRLARKLNDAKKMDVVSGGYTEALSPGKQR